MISFLFSVQVFIYMVNGPKQSYRPANYQQPIRKGVGGACSVPHGRFAASKQMGIYTTFWQKI
jgi:hypothetical protein